MTNVPAKTDLLDLNRDCFCMHVDPGDLRRTIAADSESIAALLAERPNYFANTGVFVSPGDQRDMLDQVQAIERVINSKPYQAEILNRDALTSVDTTAGVFMGYDFHLTPDGPRLIEINSNAGGAYIVAAMQRALNVGSDATEDLLYAMFAAEWRKAGQHSNLQSLVIVDEQPEQQFHYPDMCLAAASLRRRGLKVAIADPSQLSIQHGRLYLGRQQLDLVYNRLTDFSLSEPANAVIRQAWLERAAVVTPAPQHHALYADKRNLALLADAQQLSRWGFGADVVAVLSRLPRSMQVDPTNSATLWTERRAYFFKPHAGFGSRAAYRGAKLTSRVWRHITSSSYIAQEFVPPPLRAVQCDDDKVVLKFDVRVYTYEGAPLLWAARVYQGQTTNLRTRGGGLAAVIPMEATSGLDACVSSCR